MDLQGRRWVAGGLLAAVMAGFLLAPGTLISKLGVLCSGICVQRPAHSYFVAGVQLPLEAREVGTYGGFLVAVGTLILLGRGRSGRLPSTRYQAVLIAFVALMGLDGFNALFHDLRWPHVYAPDNRIRLGTGLLAGAAFAAVLLPIFNFTFWRQQDVRPSLDRPAHLGAILAANAGLYMAVTSGWNALLYPLAILSAGGAVILLTTLNTVIMLMVAGREGGGRSCRDILVPGTIALSLSLIELGALGLFRYVTLGPTPFL